MVEFESLHDSVSLLLANVQLQSFLAFVVGDKVVFEGQDLVRQDRVINPLLVVDGPRVKVGLIYTGRFLNSNYSKIYIERIA